MSKLKETAHRQEREQGGLQDLMGPALKHLAVPLSLVALAASEIGASEQQHQTLEEPTPAVRHLDHEELRALEIAAAAFGFHIEDPGRLDRVKAAVDMAVDSTPELAVDQLISDVRVEGKVKKLITLSEHFGRASFYALSKAGEDALYVYIAEESDRVERDIRFTLPGSITERNGVPVFEVNGRSDVAIDLPDHAEVKMSIWPIEVDYDGKDVREFRTELEIKYKTAQGSDVKQKVKVEPYRISNDAAGVKQKYTRVEVEREEKPCNGDGDKSKCKAEVKLVEERSEDWEGLEGGPEGPQ